jgi:hypothetical protein
VRQAADLAQQSKHSFSSKSFHACTCMLFMNAVIHGAKSACCLQRQDGTVENDKVYSRHLKWLPSGSEYPSETGTMFGQQQPASLDAKPIDGDILIAKLRPGQYVELEAHAVKGIGADHAKFSPVGTAWHRLYPEIVILQVAPLSALRV